MFSARGWLWRVKEDLREGKESKNRRRDTMRSSEEKKIVDNLEGSQKTATGSKVPHCSRRLSSGSMTTVCCGI